MKSIFLPLIFLFCLVTGCHVPDELIRDNTDNVSTLTVYGTLVQNSTEYTAVIDDEYNIITLEVPYYISDTEEIMSDLTQIKFRANLPLGCIFEPGLSGIHDLSDNQVFTSTLVYETGDRVPYVFRAVRKKSSDAYIVSASVTSEDVRVTISITDPTESDNGQIRIFNTSGSVAAAITSTALTPSPWATIYAPGYDAETGIANLVYATQVVVISQDGTTKNKYDISLETPDLVSPGNVGYIESLFGIQCTGSNPYGFEQDANYTIATVDDYLIVSNKNDFNKMIVFNRFSGRHLEDVSVNTSGIDSGRQIRAITTDDGGHLVAFTYTSTVEMDETDKANGHDRNLTPTAVKAWVWLDGIQSAPTQFLEEDIASDTFTSMASTVTEIGNTIYVTGNLESGSAVMTTIDKFVSRIIMFHFQNGVLQDVSQVCPSQNGVLQWVSTWNASKAIPVGSSYPVDNYFISLTSRYQQVYCQWGSNLFAFEVPTTYWWNGGGTYGYDIRGVDYVEFNGLYLMAIANGFVSNSVWSHRLYVANVSAVPSTESLINGFIFDSRESTEISGAGYSVTGMTSTYPFNSSDTTFGGENIAGRGDVAFCLSEDGNSVQVYMMNMNAGILAYEITRYDM